MYRRAHFKTRVSKVIANNWKYYSYVLNRNYIGNCYELNEDANSLIKRIEGDILYLDPPYNSRQYSANYHLLNTIADYKSFTPKGKTELREYNKSNYCSKAKVQHTFKDLIRNARFRYIVLSYNNEGIMPMQTIEQIMTKYGNYQMFQKEHQRFKADKTENKNHLADTTTEYLQAKQNPQ